VNGGPSYDECGASASLKAHGAFFQLVDAKSAEQAGHLLKQG
jgi:hypothetical protein